MEQWPQGGAGRLIEAIGDRRGEKFQANKDLGSTQSDSIEASTKEKGKGDRNQLGGADDSANCGTGVKRNRNMHWDEIFEEKASVLQGDERERKGWKFSRRQEMQSKTEGGEEISVGNTSFEIDGDALKLDYRLQRASHT